MPKKTITTRVSDERIEATVEVIPGVSIRIRGVRYRATEAVTGHRILKLCPKLGALGARYEFRGDAFEKLVRLPLETLRTLGGLLFEYQSQRLELPLLRDAFLHEADIDLRALDAHPWHDCIAVQEFLSAVETEIVDVEFDRTFSIGDEVETGGCNLTYTDPITGITPKTVTTSGGVNGASQRFTLLKFVRANWDLDLAKIRKRNAEEMQCI